MKTILTFFMILSACLICWPAGAADNITDLSLQLEGRAKVSNNDLARARDEAVRNALDKGILQSAAIILGHKSEDEKFQSMKSVLIGKSDQFVKNYRIVSEKNDRDQYVVMVSALISQAAVKDELTDMNLMEASDKDAKTQVSVVLRGVKKHSDFIRFVHFLKNRSGIVKSLYPCSLEWQKVQCELTIAGDVQILAAELERAGRYFVETPVKKISGVEINLTLKEDGK